MGDTPARIGPATAYGNTFKHKKTLSDLGWRWNGEQGCWTHRNWDSSKTLPTGVICDFVEPPKPETLGDLIEKLNNAKAMATTQIVYSNDRQYARAKEAQAFAQDTVRKLEAKIAAMQKESDT